MKKAIKAAWRYTIPVFAGYIFLGIAFGFLLKTKGFPSWYPILMSLIIYSGALEFAAIPLISAPFEPLSSFIMGLLISARHLFYGIPMLKKYADSGKLKWLMIFGLTDETFSINSTVEVPETVEPKYFYLSITLLDYSYWVLGTALGALFGSFVSFDTTGIDFALTALFIVLFIEQLKTKVGKLSGFIGLLSSTVVLIFFSSKQFVIVSMAFILLTLLVFKKVINHE